MTFLDNLLAGGWRQSVDLEIRQFDYFIQGMDSLLADAARQEQECLDAEMAKMGQDDRADFMANNADALQKITDEFPMLLWNGLVVMLFAYWEKEYRAIADWLLRSFHKRRGIQHASALRVKDFNGAWYERARKAVTQYAGVPDDPALWSRLVELAAIRNVIAHDGGQASMTDSDAGPVVANGDLRSAIKSWAPHGLTVSTTGELRVTRQFVEAALALIRNYMMGLLANCEAHMAGPRGTG